MESPRIIVHSFQVSSANGSLTPSLIYFSDAMLYSFSVQTQGESMMRKKIDDFGHDTLFDCCIYLYCFLSRSQGGGGGGTEDLFAGYCVAYSI